VNSPGALTAQYPPTIMGRIVSIYNTNIAPNAYQLYFDDGRSWKQII